MVCPPLALDRGCYHPALNNRGDEQNGRHNLLRLSKRNVNHAVLHFAPEARTAVGWVYTAANPAPR
jgi:hypothetical protein